MLLFQQGKIIPETAYMMNDEDFVNAQLRQFRLEVCHERIAALPDDRDYIIGCNRNHANYYHWLIQALPTIDLAIRNRKRARDLALLLPDLKPWQAETLALLGADRLERVSLNAEPFYYVPSVEFSDFLNGNTAFSVSRSAVATYHRLKAATPYGDAVPNIVYVARTDSRQRAMANEPELIERLLSEGVEIVVPGRMSVPEQINLFRGVRAIIGGHGAGLSNIVFCTPGTIVYELIPAHYQNACFNRLAQAVGLRYRADLFESVGEERDAHAREWRVDVHVVVATLREIRSALSGHRRIETAMDYLKRARATTHASSPAEPPPDRTPPPEQGAGRFSRLARAIGRWLR
jgi:capsular polysaccharide biosynthesis protein